MNFQIFLVLLYFLLQSLATFFVISQTHEATLYTILFVLVGASYMFTICRNSGYVNRKEPIDSIIEEGEVSEFPSEPSNIQNPTHRNIHHHEEQRVELHQKCRICHIKQPLRTKHCHECNRCVPTFDHHCPWLHTCIGEKNRPAFLMFLLFQEIQLIFIGKQLGVSLVEEGLMKVQVEKAMLTLLFIFGIIGFGSLLVFHLYLMGANLTTWEFVKWKTIIYLKNKEPKKVSPFSKGLLRNISQYFAISFSKEPKSWQLELES